MRRRTLIILSASLGLVPSLLLGATATFVAVGPTTVPPGTDVTFDIVIRATDPLGFDAANIVIGSNGAADLAFVYSPAWTFDFDNVTTPVAGLGIYAHDVFVGANSAEPVSNGILLGTITIKTVGLAEGAFDVRIDPAIDGGVSRVTLDGTLEPLVGSGSFTVECVAADTDCDGSVDLVNYANWQSCMTGPATITGAACDPQDINRDGRVDLRDASIVARQFTGTN